MMRHACLLCLPLLVTACDPADTPADDDPAAQLRAGNSMRCSAGPLALNGSGEQVGLGSFGIHKGQLSLGLDLDVERNGQHHVVSTSLMGMPLKPGTYYFPDAASKGPSYASYDIRDDERNPLKKYSGGHYWFNFSAVEVDPQAKLKFVIEQVGVSAAPHAGMQRVHLAGSFAFNAAALPGDQQSDACMKDGIMRSLKTVNGQRLLPMLDARLCGAEKIHVQCRYDVTADLLSQ